MKLEIYHQLGFRGDWSFESLRSEEGGHKTGDGVIISAKNIEMDDVESKLDTLLDRKIRKQSMFDSQYFIPKLSGSEADKLKTYGFAPVDIKTTEAKFTDKITGKEKIRKERVGRIMTERLTLEHIEKCLDFQFRNDFRYLVIPTLYPKEMKGFIGEQFERFVSPFLDRIRRLGTSKEVLLQLTLNSDIIKGPYREDILNWVTGIRDIHGIYLIVGAAKTPKQIQDEEYLSSMLEFIQILVANKLKIILGYLNTEALLLSIASPNIVTVGSFENTRRFSTGPKHRRRPKPRVYFPKLLQWVHSDYLGDIYDKLPDPEGFLSNDKYAYLISKAKREKLGQEEVYLHHFLAFSKQLRKIARVEEIERYKQVRTMITEAQGNYEYLRKNRVRELKKESDSDHLEIWKRVADNFAKTQGWR